MEVFGLFIFKSCLVTAEIVVTKVRLSQTDTRANAALTQTNKHQIHPIYPVFWV